MAVQELIWHDCYGERWDRLLDKRSFAHPAKFSAGLIRRIYAHGLEAGWWRKGDLIGDPFGGVACGGIMAGFAGLDWVGVELEPRFVEWGNANLAIHGPDWMAAGLVSSVQLIQGDIRRFAELVGRAAGIVTSPPYADNQRSDRTVERRDAKRGYRQGEGCFRTSESYGNGDGQIGALPAGNLSAVVTSPPYAQGLGRGGGPSYDALTADKKLPRAGYGESRGQIENLPTGAVDAVVTSPPYADQRVEKNSTTIDLRKNYETYRANGGGSSFEKYAATQARHSQGYGGSAGQIGVLKGGRNGTTYASQVGRAAGETYWQAMATVYRQCLLALRPGGYMAVVVKDFVRKGRRVPLCDQTLRLLTSLGFSAECRVRAMLVKETREPCLFGGELVKETSRKIFFRRLQESKGAPRIDWEEVLIVRKPP